MERGGAMETPTVRANQGGPDTFWPALTTKRGGGGVIVGNGDGVFNGAVSGKYLFGLLSG